MKKKLAILAIIIGLTALFLIKGIPGTAVIDKSPGPVPTGPEKDTPMVKAEEKTQMEESLPYIDRIHPERTETATFALG